MDDTIFIPGAEGYEPSPSIKSDGEVFAFPVVSKKTNVIGVAYHRGLRKLRITYRTGAVLQFMQVPEEHFLAHVSHGATIDDKLEFFFRNRFACKMVPREKMFEWRY